MPKHTRKKHRKKPLQNRFGPPFWPPKPSQNPPKIGKKRKKSLQKKSHKKERKIAPTWLQHGLQKFRSVGWGKSRWHGWAPLRYIQQVFKSNIKIILVRHAWHLRRCGGFKWLRHATDPLKARYFQRLRNLRSHEPGEA